MLYQRCLINIHYACFRAGNIGKVSEAEPKQEAAALLNLWLVEPECVRVSGFNLREIM